MMTSKQGWINLYKPKNITSFKAIKIIKKVFHINKIGHAGTLDPMAEGILPIAIGKATKLIPYISCMNKEYDFTITWEVKHQQMMQKAMFYFHQIIYQKKKI